MKKNVAQFVLSILVVVLGFAGVMTYNYQKNMEKYAAVAQKAPVPKQPQVEIDPRAWKTVEAPPPVYGTRPVIPPIPPNVYYADAAGQMDPSMRLKYVVQNHPDLSISATLSRLIESGALPLSFETQPGMVAQFTYLSSAMVTESTLPLPGEWFPVFTFNPSNLVNMRTEEDALYAMAVTYHEFVHYQQWERSDEATRMQFAMKPAGIATPEECAHVWSIEREAYWKECELINSWGGITQMKAQCSRITNEEAFNQVLFSMMMNGPTGHRFPSCIVTWAKQAGAPYPEFYRVPGY